MRTASADIWVKIVGAMPCNLVRQRSSCPHRRVRAVTVIPARVHDLAADVDACCRLSGTFTLRSGQVSSEYFDKYLFESDPALLARVAQPRWSTWSPRSTELLGGLELGGVPIATMLSSLTGHRALFVRKQAKTYGTCKLAEGPSVEGRRVTLVEDVITTGGAVRDATNALREAGAIVEVVVCAIDRSPEGENPLADVGLEVRAGADQGRPGRRAARRLTARTLAPLRGCSAAGPGASSWSSARTGSRGRRARCGGACSHS